MRKLLLLLGILPIVAFSQNNLFKRIKYHPGHTVPSVMVLADGVDITALESKSFLKNQLNLKGNEDLQVVRQFSDYLGFEHIRYQQTINNIPVFGAEYTAHIKDGMVVKYTGHAFTGIQQENASISRDQAMQLALNHLPASVYMWQDAFEEATLKRIKHNPEATYYPQPKLMYFNTTLELKKPRFQLAYEVDVYAKEPLKKEKIYVSAVNGSILNSINQLHDADQEAVGVSMFSDTVSIMTSDTLGGYALFDYSRGGGIETYDMNTQTNYSQAVPFVHNDTIWDIANAESDEAAIDAHWGAEMTYDYFFQKHGRDSYDNNGSIIQSYVHFDYQWQNASWDGSRMRYGDGGAQSNPYLSIDIAGHEMGHGVTQEASGLIYAAESGGLNESFSDIFGNSIEYFADSTKSNWYVGELSGNTLRNMSDPNEFNDPDTYLGGYWVPTANPSQGNDWGGVHTNSGVQNFWYYLLVEGGSGTNDNGDSYNVNAMGWDEAGAIAYRNLEVYLTASSGYFDAREFAYESAADIYGDCTPEAENVIEAWYAVGVGRRFDAEVEPNFMVNYDYACALPLFLDFRNETVGATSYYWDFGNGKTSASESPSESFITEGSYTIELNAYLDNGCYSDTGMIIRTLNVIEAGSPNAPACSSDVFLSSNFVGIDRVRLRTLDYESGIQDDDYNDYTCKSNTVLHVDSTYQIIVNTNLSSRENVRVWIDLNNDGDFADDELMFSNDDTYTNHVGTIDFSGKTVALQRPLLMRVMSDISFNKNFNSCEGLQNGQTEDYSVVITDDWNEVISGVAESAFSPISIFPNPAEDIVSVSLEAGEKLQSFSLLDIHGKTITTVKTSSLSLTDVPAGVYVVEVETNQQKYTEKLLVK